MLLIKVILGAWQIKIFIARNCYNDTVINISFSVFTYAEVKTDFSNHRVSVLLSDLAAATATELNV